MTEGRKFYFISYEAHYEYKGVKALRNKLIRDIHPLEWQVQNDQHILLNWKEISEGEFTEFRRINVIDRHREIYDS